MALRTHPDNPPVLSDACRECGGAGTVWDWDFDCAKRRVPCPACRGEDARAEVRARMAREFGTDRQRKAGTR